MCIFVKCIYVDLCIVVCLDTCIFASLYSILTCTYEVRIYTIFKEVHVFVYINGASVRYTLKILREILLFLLGETPLGTLGRKTPKNPMIPILVRISIN